MSIKQSFLGSFILAIIFFSVPSTADAQAPVRMTSGEIHQAIKKMRVLGSALYIAAHPDDENTRLISYLSNEVNAHTTYLSLTRGDGGQNLVGSEIRELLGLIRTQELLMARSIDGGHQRFTRANDFGYSKTPEETLEFWNEDEVMSDVIWAIRTIQPDVIINRFPHYHLNGNHGHHTASGMLSHEAFDMAGRRSVFPEHLQYVEPWQPRRLFFNTSWWFYGSREKFDEADKSKMLTVEVGNYYPMRALSNTEIAAQSRSMHKSQGFGSSGTRGSQEEYLELLKGDMPTDQSIFQGIDISWNRVSGGGPIDGMLQKIETQFDHQYPAASVPALLNVRQAIASLSPSIWQTRKLKEVDIIIEQCMGLFAEALAADFWATPGDSIQVSIEMTNRSDQQLTLTSVKFGAVELIEEASECKENQPFNLTTNIHLPEDLGYTSPYWLANDWSEGMYDVKDQNLRGLPQNPRNIGVQFSIEIDGQQLTWFKPLVYKRTDPVKGEVYRPFELVPSAFVNISESVLVFADPVEKPIEVRIKSAKDDISGVLRLKVPEGWAVTPESVDIALPRKGDEHVVTFALIPPGEQQIGHIKAELEVEGRVMDQSVVQIEHDHIPSQTILKPATAKVVKVDLVRAGNRIGYIMGAGDDIPGSLEQVGYDVDLLDENQVNASMLSKYDAVILGVRTYNTSDRIRHIQGALFDYVEKGGTLVTQYNTSRRIKADSAGPFPLTLSRTRVTDETAAVEILLPDHALMHYPNEITNADFDGWVQERGLYFAGEWDANYEALLRMNDPGEEPADGSLLVAPYGDGQFIYTSLSWFRQLPAGVPGAFRLFVNLISQGSPSRS